MTRTVFKYPIPIPIEDTFTLDLPVGAEVLTCADQVRHATNVNLMLWALVDPDAPTEPRTFRLAGTGHRIDGEARYIATALLMGGALVLHLFEVDA